MSDTIDALIDDLVEAIDDEDANRTRNLIRAIGNRYDELSTDEEKRIRQATILRGNGDLSEDEKEQLGQLVSTAANTEMKRGAFLIRAVAAVRELEQDSTSQDDFEQAVTEVKNADENLETEVNSSKSVVEGLDIPPSVAIVNLRLDPTTVALGQTSQMVVTIANIGDEPADGIELSLDLSEGVSVSEPLETIGTIGSDEDRTKTFEVKGQTLGEQRIRVELTSANADSDIDSRALTVEEADELDVGDYTNQDGIVDTEGLRAAVADWRAGEIDTELLRDVVDAWRSGDPVA